MTANHENRRADNRDNNGALAIALGLVFGTGLGVAVDAALGTHGIGIGAGGALGIMVGSLFISTPKTEGHAACYKRSFVVFTPLGGILLLLGLVSLASGSEVLRALAWGFLFGAFVFMTTGLAHGRRYWRLSR